MPFKVKKLTPIDTTSLESLGKGVVDLSKYTEDEFASLARSLQAIEPQQVLYVAPPKPRQGTIVYADGTHWNPGHGEGPYYFNGTSWFPAGAGSFAAVRRQIFTTPGTATYTPSANMVYCIVEAVGGGGAGGGSQGATTTSYAGGGGGAGGYSRSVLTAAAVGASQTVTVGAAGVGASGAYGTNGGDSSFGSLVIAKGGNAAAPGTASAMGAGGAGGVAGTGDIAAAGAPGDYGSWNNQRNTIIIISVPGTGGSSFYGGGGRGYGGATGGGQALAGLAASNYGSGGGGGLADAIAANAAGGNGSPGLVAVTEFCSS